MFVGNPIENLSKDSGNPLVRLLDDDRVLTTLLKICHMQGGRGFGSLLKNY
jgi:hypothetical protein